MAVFDYQNQKINKKSLKQKRILNLLNRNAEYEQKRRQGMARRGAARPNQLPSADAEVLYSFNLHF